MCGVFELSWVQNKFLIIICTCKLYPMTVNGCFNSVDTTHPQHLFYFLAIQEKMGILNNGEVYAVFDYDAHNSDELEFRTGDKMIILRKGDETEKEWWWAQRKGREGYVPRNLLGVSYNFY